MSDTVVPEGYNGVLTHGDWKLLEIMRQHPDDRVRKAASRWAYHAGLFDGLRLVTTASDPTQAAGGAAEREGGR